MEVKRKAIDYETAIVNRQGDLVIKQLKSHIDLINASHVIRCHFTNFLILTSVLSVKDSFARFVHLDFSDDYIRSRKSNIYRLTIYFLSCASFNMNDIFLSVNSSDFSFSLFEFTSCDKDFIILTKWKRTNLIKNNIKSTINIMQYFNKITNVIFVK
jgi:hypothetical protein